MPIRASGKAETVSRKAICCSLETLDNLRSSSMQRVEKNDQMNDHFSVFSEEKKKLSCKVKTYIEKEQGHRVKDIFM